jgi:hypothetical protein
MGRGGSVYKPGRLEPRRYLGRYPGRRLRPPPPSPQLTTSAVSYQHWPVLPGTKGRYYRSLLPRAQQPPTGRKMGPLF